MIRSKRGRKKKLSILKVQHQCGHIQRHYNLPTLTEKIAVERYQKLQATNCDKCS